MFSESKLVHLSQNRSIFKDETFFLQFLFWIKKNLQSKESLLIGTGKNNCVYKDLEANLISEYRASWLKVFTTFPDQIVNYSMVITRPKRILLNPLHPNISRHILHTVHHTCTMVLTRRIWLTIKSCFGWWSFPLFSWPSSVIQGWYCKEKVDASHF